MTGAFRRVVGDMQRKFLDAERIKSLRGRLLPTASRARHIEL